MPKCKKCGKIFNKRVTIDGKERVLSSRRNCFDCVPFNTRRTRKISDDDIKDSIDCKCKYCGRKYLYFRKSGHTKEVCNSCLVNRRRFILKQKMVEYKGGKCSICGYDKSSYALCFHHVTDDKKFNISGCHCNKWDTIQKELDKCILLCQNCHHELHGREHDADQCYQQKHIEVNFTCSFEILGPIEPPPKDRPTKDELAALLWEIPATHIAAIYGVSDVVIGKWANKYGLTKPPRGYWTAAKAAKQ